MFTPFRTYRRKIKSMNVLATAGNFFYFSIYTSTGEVSSSLRNVLDWAIFGIS